MLMESFRCDEATYTAQRHKAIDYTIPIFPRVYSSLITSRVTGTTTNLTVYMERFSLMAWGMIALTALILAAAFFNDLVILMLGLR